MHQCLKSEGACDEHSNANIRIENSYRTTLCYGSVFHVHGSARDRKWSVIIFWRVPNNKKKDWKSEESNNNNHGNKKSLFHWKLDSLLHLYAFFNPPNTCIVYKPMHVTSTHRFIFVILYVSFSNSVAVVVNRCWENENESTTLEFYWNAFSEINRNETKRNGPSIPQYNQYNSAFEWCVCLCLRLFPILLFSFLDIRIPLCIASSKHIVILCHGNGYSESYSMLSNMEYSISVNV